MDPVCPTSLIILCFLMISSKADLAVSPDGLESFSEGLSFVFCVLKALSSFLVNIFVQTVGAIVAALLVVNQVTSNYSVCWNIMNFLYIRQLVYIFLNFGVIGFQMYSLKNMINKYI